MLPNGPELLPGAAGRERGQVPGAVQGPVQEPDGPDRDRHARTRPRSCSTWRSRSRTSTTWPTIPQTAPVPPDKDTGANYQLHTDLHRPVHVPELPAEQAAGPGPEPAVERRRTEPERQRSCPARSCVNMNMNPNDVDNRLLAGDAQVDCAGTGVQAAARAKILSNADAQGLVRRPDHRVRLVLLHRHHGGAADQRALPDGRRVRGQQDRAAERLRRPGRRRRSPARWRHRTSSGTKLRPLRGDHQAAGDLAKAKQELQACGQPNGFCTGIAYRSDRPKEVAGRPGAAGRRCRPGRDQGHAARLPDAARTTPTSRACRSTSAQHDIGLLICGWGARLAGRLRLLLLHLRTAPRSSRPGTRTSWMLNDPVVNNLLAKMAATTDADHAEPDLGPDRHAGHEGRGHRAGRVRQGAALPAARR